MDGLRLRDKQISIHAPRTGSDKTIYCSTLSLSISIHAPRTGSDDGSFVEAVTLGISIHAPRTGSDSDRWQLYHNCKAFQSTLPARGATFIIGKRVDANGYFNPRSPHGERPKRSAPSTSTQKFQSTLPARGATMPIP